MPGFWRQCRIAFRCVRIAVWLLVLTVLGLLLWCNRVGLPDFLKEPLIATLQQQGVDLDFSRMRLSLVRGVVADNVRLAPAGTNAHVTLAARTIHLEVNYPALWRQRRLELNGLTLRNGRFSCRLSPTNVLTLTNLQTELRFGTNDTWSLDHFHAELHGAQIGIAGQLAHASEIQNWGTASGPARGKMAPHPAMKTFNGLVNTFRQIHFEEAPHLQLTINGDARNLHSLLFHLRADVVGIRTPWFNARGIQGDATLTLPAGHRLTNTLAGCGFWTNLQPFRLGWSVKLDELHLPAARLNAHTLACAGKWEAPALTLTKFHARFANGGLAVNARLNVPARTVAFTSQSDFDPHVLTPFLARKIRAQLAAISWSEPPVLQIAGSAQLPPWTQPAERDLVEHLSRTLKTRGQIAFTNAMVDGIHLDRLRTHFHYANRLWDFTGLNLVQGRTGLQASGEANAATKNFHCRLTGQLDGSSLRPFLKNTNALAGFDLLTLHQPLHLDLQAGGNWQTWQDVTAAGRLALTNFAVRGQSVDSLVGDMIYTNQTMRFFHPRLTRAGGLQHFAADRVTIDIAGQKLFIHGGAGKVKPVAVARAIGPETARVMEHYQFPGLPTARVNGCIPLKQVGGNVVQDDANLWVEIVGTTPFHWRKFNTPAIAGRIHWRSHYLILTNIESACYGGEAHGWGKFDLSPEIVGTDFSFHVAGTNVDLHRMSVALWNSTNQLEGNLSGNLTVTRANSESWHSWNGFGHVNLQNGLLWDVPIFAFMSPVLNAVSPGLGNSRATDAAADFTLTNGVLHTDSLLVRSTMMRLQYSGTVDLRENVNARVTAQLLRNTPVVGTLVSTVLWPVSKIFECQVTGKLESPVVKPLYIPKILLVPLHPLHSLEELFSPAAKQSAD